MNEEESQVVLYTSPAGKVMVNAIVQNETLWLAQAAMAQPFGCGADKVVKHIKNVFEEGELQEKATTEVFFQ